MPSKGSGKRSDTLAVAAAAKRWEEDEVPVTSSEPEGSVQEAPSETQETSPPVIVQQETHHLAAIVEAEAISQVPPQSPPVVRSAVVTAKEASVSYLLSAKCMAISLGEMVKSKGVKPLALESAATARQALCNTTAYAKNEGGRLLQEARTKASELATSAQVVAKDTSFQTAAASAAGGAVIIGAGGGAAGLAAGALVGTTTGLLAAPFTFGLSIPVGAAVGSLGGLVTGAVAGSTLGVVGGGAAGYGAYVKRNEIATAATSAVNKASDSTLKVRGWTTASVDYMCGQVSVARARLLQRRRS